MGNELLQKPIKKKKRINKYQLVIGLIFIASIAYAVGYGISESDGNYDFSTIFADQSGRDIDITFDGSDCSEFIASRAAIDPLRRAEAIRVYDPDGQIIWRERYEYGELERVEMYADGEYQATITYRHSNNSIDNVSRNSFVLKDSEDIFDLDIYQIVRKVENKINYRNRKYYTTEWQAMNLEHIALLKDWLNDPYSVLPPTSEHIQESKAITSIYKQCNIMPPIFPYYPGLEEPVELIYGKGAFRDESDSLYYYTDIDGEPVTGKIVRYHDDGTLRSIVIAVGGFAEGDIRKYYEGGAELELISPYENGELNGDQFSYGRYNMLSNNQPGTDTFGVLKNVD